MKSSALAFVRILLAGFLASLLLLSAHAAPPPWSEAPYSHYADKAPVSNVLREFATTFNLSLELSPAVTGRVNGRFQAKSPTDFLNQLGAIYGFHWFTYAGTLYVSRNSEMVTTSVPVSGASMTTLRNALTSLRIMDERWGWGELPEQGLILVSGPPAYVALVQRTVGSLPVVASGQQIEVFRLKNASAEDRIIAYRGREITTYGLARVLRDLVSGDTTALSGMLGSETVNQLAAPLRNSSSGMPTTPTITGSLFGGGESSPDAPGAPVSRAAPGYAADLHEQRRPSPSIQSDPRLNALIIRDTPDRMPVYRTLIEQLDVPTPLIEIEAMIIDINSTRLDELGIAWGGRRGGTAAGFGNISPDGGGLTISAAPTSSNISPLSTVLDTGNYLVTRIRALESQGEASIQSRPSILTVDHTGALLDLSETFYIRTTGERVATVTPITVGTSLRVTPHYIDRPGIGPTIQLDVDIEDGQIQDITVDNLPTVRRTNVSTQAIVGENQTLVIGGYNTQQRLQQDDKIPILGHIPLLGALFSYKSTSVQSRERLFLIKPRLVALESRPNGDKAEPQIDSAADGESGENMISPMDLNGGGGDE